MSAIITESNSTIRTLAGGNSQSGGAGEWDLRECTERIHAIIERNQNEEFLRLLLTTAISLERQIK